MCRIDRFSDYTHRRKLDEPRRDRCESHTGESHSLQYTNTDGVYGGAYTISVLSLDVRLITALQVLQEPPTFYSKANRATPKRFL